MREPDTGFFALIEGREKYMIELNGEKCLIVDGHSLAFRAFYALPLLKNSAGLYTNAIYGFMTMLFPLLEKEQPDYCTVVFDASAATFRHQLFSGYKAQRKRSPVEFREQLPRIKEILQAMKITVFELDGYEADDIIGTIVHHAEGKKINSMIITGDNDLLQLLSSLTSVCLTRRGISNLKSYTPKTLAEKYGLNPEQMVDFRGLKGDPSDNIPGVPGIGEKTALKLLKQYHNLENVLDNVQEVRGKKIRDNLIKYTEQARLSKELSIIKCDVPLQFSWEGCRLSEPDYHILAQHFRELEFKKLLERLPTTDSSCVNSFAKSRLISTVDELSQLCRQLDKASFISLLCKVKTSPSFGGDAIVLAISFDSGNGYFIVFAPEDKDEYKKNEEIFSATDVWKHLQPYLEDPSLPKHCYDLKLLYKITMNAGINLNNVSLDPLVAAYLLDPLETNYSLSRLTKKYLDYTLPEIQDNRTKDDKNKKDDLFYQGGLLSVAVCTISGLSGCMYELLKDQSLDKLYDDLEHPLTVVLADMEHQGIKVDVKKLEELKADIHEKLSHLEAEIYILAGEEFNLNSPKQLAIILFERLKLPVIKRTKTGHSTDARVLAELAPRHEIAGKLLDYRQLIKLESTYLSAFLPLVDQKTKKVYTTFNQTVTATGRLSSSEPNLQNIPVRLAEGRRIREAFVPSEDGWFFLAADYSQIELRVLAHISEDCTLINAFLEDEDIHRRTAAEIFNLPPDDVTSIMRARAKAINFGIVYGMSDYGLSQNIGVSREEAKKYIENYFELYRGVRQYMDEIIVRARETGFVTTLLNRRRYLPEIISANFNKRSFAERTARNTPIQGSAADIIKLAMLKIYDKLKNSKTRARMLLQVHDELIFEVPQDELSVVAAIARNCMESSFPLRIPLKVDLKIGKNWAHMQSYEGCKNE